MQPTDPNAQPNEPQATPEQHINPMPGQPVSPTPEAEQSPQPVVSSTQPNMQPETPTVAPPIPQASEAPTPQATATVQPIDYVSNPFLNAVRGLVAILKSNPAPVMLAGLWFILGYLGFYILLIVMSRILPSPVTLLVSVIAMIVGWMVIYGAYIDIAARSAAEEAITTKQAFSKGLQKALPLLGFSILAGLAVTFGLFLLIIPGVIIAARLSLGPLVMFEENLGVVASMKRSAELTKGHVNEMLGALFAGMLMASQGLLIGAISLAPMVGRYRDLKALKESGAPKPKVHWLNYSYLFIIVMIGLLFLLITTSALQLNKSQKDTQLQYDTNRSFQYNVNNPSTDYNDSQIDSW